MRILVLAMCVGMGACNYVDGQPHGSSNRNGTTDRAVLKGEDSFIDRELKKIADHKKILVESGHMDEEFHDEFTILGQYGWHGENGGYFGAYSFSEASFEQAKRGWFIHGKVLEGSDELWADDSRTHFDQSAIGYLVQGMSMSWFANGKYTHAWFSGKIIGIKDEGRVAILDKRAPHHAEQWGMQIVPADWRDLCNCTNNFHPPFVDGQPVVD